MPLKDNFDIIHQRFFNESDSGKNNLSALPDRHLYFEMTNSGTAKETRHLVLTDKNDKPILKVELNKFGGFSPTPGHGMPRGSALSPSEPVLIMTNVEFVLDKERVFYTDINLSKTPEVEVYFRIYRPFIEDKRKIVFVITNPSLAAFDSLEIPMDGNNGKKPWELSAFFFKDVDTYLNSCG